MYTNLQEPIAIFILGQKLKPEKCIKNILIPRLETGSEIYKDLKNQNKNVNIIISGGDVANIGITETDFMANYLVFRKNIPHNNIILENKAKNTYENMVFSIPLLIKFNSIILVTSDYHMDRSIYILKFLYKNNNIIPHPVSTNNITNYEKNELVKINKQALHEFKKIFTL